MFYFVQYSPNKKEAWTMVDEKGLKAKPTAFCTILGVSHNPEDFLVEGVNPDEYVKYLGPMFFDLDGADIASVITDARRLVSQMEDRFDVDPQSLSIYLSGKKGLHITVSHELFGIKSAKLYLPLVWKRFAQQFDIPSLDMSIYSLKKGRMWRQTGVKRPDNGKYKVQITYEELLNLTDDMYHDIVSEPRRDLPQPPLGEPLPRLVSFFNSTNTVVGREVKKRAQDEASTVVSDLSKLVETPGCIQKLITEGDCPASNWNQAAMQLAAYIAGRYSAGDSTYEQDLVEPFLKNVSSSSRPNLSDRRGSFNALLSRAKRGSIKFYTGALIATLGTPCGNCVLCNGSSGDGGSEHPAPDDQIFYDKLTKIKVSKTGIYRKGEDSSKTLSNFSMTPETVFSERDNLGQERVVSCIYKVSSKYAEELPVELDESAFNDRRAFQAAITGTNSVFVGNESDLQLLWQTMMKMREGLDPQVRTPLAGLTFQEKAGDYYPHLVLRDGSYGRNGVPSKYVYTGQPSLAPSFEGVPDFVTQQDVDNGVEALRDLLHMNDLDIILPAIGWIMATHIKPHITLYSKGFPMLGLCGSSETGKSATAFLLLALNGFPYQGAPLWNSETDTVFALEEMVTSSSTFVRLVEEANEHNARRHWHRLVGVLKSSWDEGGIKKAGQVKGSKTLKTVYRANPAPIMYLAEQSFPITSVRTRSIECFFNTRTIKRREYYEAHERVVTNHKYLERWAKVFSITALNTPPSKVRQWLAEETQKLPAEFGGRARTAYGSVLTGVRFLAYILETYSGELAEEVIEMKEVWLDTLRAKVGEMLQTKRRSVIDEFVLAVDSMAGESDSPQHGLVAGQHYWRSGGLVYLDVKSIFPKYRRYTKGIGLDSSLTTVAQATQLLEGEYYYVGTTPHPDAPDVMLTSLDLDKLAAKGIRPANLNEETLT